MPRGASVLTGSKRTAAGRRTVSVAIQHATDTVGASRMTVRTWATRPPTVMMSRLDVRADEREAGAQTSAFMETVFQMPYLATMDPNLVDVPKMRRLVVSGRIFDIRAASFVDRRSIELLTLAGSRLA